MTLYRATDAADTMNMAAMLIAAYRQHVGVERDTLESYVGERGTWPSRRFHSGQRVAEEAQRPEDDS